MFTIDSKKTIKYCKKKVYKVYYLTVGNEELE